MWPANALPPVHLKLYQMKLARKKAAKKLKYSLTKRKQYDTIVKD